MGIQVPEDPNEVLEGTLAHFCDALLDCWCSVRLVGVLKTLSLRFRYYDYGSQMHESVIG
jgi:hypothetical protein